MPRKYIRATQADSSDHDNSSDRSPSSMGKSDPLDFRPTSSDPMLHGGRPSYEEHDLWYEGPEWWETSAQLSGSTKDTRSL